MKYNLFPLAVMFAACLVSPASAASVGTALHQPFIAQGETDEMKKMLRHEFGFSFLVYRDKIQAELGLSAEQKTALEKYLAESAPADMEFLQSKAEHQSEFEAFRTKAVENLEVVLKKTLNEVQRKRLGELVRQREGLFGGPSLWTGLDITDEEKSHFMAIIEPMHKKMVAAVAGAEQATDRSEIEHKVLGLRADLERQMEDLLTDEQRKLWKEMLGKPIDISALYDLSSGK
jgi:hypothetical protein